MDNKKNINAISLFPDEREKRKTRQEQLKCVLVRLLKIFDYICKKHDIDYWLDYGTLLGAIRQKGFIPWDNDIDIGILRADYELFLEKGVKELPRDIFFRMVILIRVWRLSVGWLKPVCEIVIVIIWKQ